MADKHDSENYDERNTNPKCHFVHHFNPFLNLGPFLIEVKFYQPFRTIIHEFFLETEINWIIKYSKPRLTKSRAAVDSFHLREIGSSAHNNINSKDKTQQKRQDTLTWTSGQDHFLCTLQYTAHFIQTTTH